MAEAILSERRTRSQLTLPDNILNIPECSPLKTARTAMRKHKNTSDKAVEESDEDELLLSPGKAQPHMKIMNNSKRSASPPHQDEYRSPGSLSEGRELKRIRRNEITGGEYEGNNGKGRQPSAGHSRTRSDPNIVPGRRSTRKQFASNAKKPMSAVSASPPPTTFSPAPSSPQKERAQSVPVFPTANDIPRIDFRNPPRSPKRRRSPSRSPSKDRESKLQFTPFRFTLPTIQDDITMNVNESDLQEESRTTTDLPMPEVAMDVTLSGKDTIIPDAPSTPSARTLIQSSFSVGEIIPASPSTGEMAPASPPTRQTIVPSSPPALGEVIPASPPTPVDSTAPAMDLRALATPATQSQNLLFAMSPLTPLPETPLPTKYMADADAEDRDAENMGWQFEPMKELTPSSELPKPQPAIVPSTSQSRLPRLSMAPPITPKSSRPSAMAPPSTLPIKKAVLTKSSAALAAGGSKVSGSAPKDAFAVLMKRPTEQRAKLDAEKSKLKERGGKAMEPPASFFASVGKSKEDTAADSSLKPKKKLREKMRPREKREEKTPFAIVLPDEEEEVERNVEAESESKDANPADTKGTPVDSALVEATRESAIIPEEVVTKDKAMGEQPSTNVDDTPTVSESAVPKHKEAVDTGTPSLSINESHGTQEHDLSIKELTTAVDIDVQPHAEEIVAPADIQTKEAHPDQQGTETTEPRPVPQTGKSKLPLSKKRQPASIPLPVRVTRSASNNKKNGETGGSQIAEPSRKKQTTLRPTPAAGKRTASGSLKKRGVAEPTETEDAAMVVDAADTSTVKEELLPPGSPMRISPVKSSPKVPITENDDDIVFSSLPTPTKSPRPPPSPSPTKIARSTLLAMKKPSAASVARTFSSSSLHSSTHSSLSTLSNALEKLRMPAPSRPSTSMGFNRDRDEDDTEARIRSKDDVAIGRTSMGLERKTVNGVQRSATLGSSSFKPSSNASASTSKTGSSTGNKLVQKPLSMFMSSKGGITKPGTTGRRMGTLGSKPSIFGIGGGPRRTVSKKSTLPVVIGSPVKGGGNDAAGNGIFREDDEAEETNAEEGQGDEDGGKIYNAIINGSSATHLLQNLLAQGPEKGKEKESHRQAHSSRRVSMLSRDLSQSLNAMPPPPPPARGTMGPPATPPTSGRSIANMGSGGSGSSASGSPSQAGASGAKRSSARIANSAPAMKAKASNDGPISAGKKVANAEQSNPAKKILKDCVIFVDVKSEDGDEAGSLFVEMLEGIGARVLTRVGQTCTHIVFKNGLMSTITRYKLLRDPKPLVVGIGWVVECVERMAQVDETSFLIDLDRTNVAGTHKRRRSILPKLFADEDGQDDSLDGDRSMDGSVSSITMDDDLTPLERARRRKNNMTGPRA